MPLYGQAIEKQTWDSLRARFGTVAPVEIAPGVATWLVLGYNETVEVLRNPSTYSHDSRGWREITEGRVKPDSPLMPIFGYRPNVVFADGAEHHRLRAAIVDGLGRLTEQRIRADIREIADQLIDRFVAVGRAEAIGQYARWLPVLVMNRAYGMDDRSGYLLAELTRKVYDSDPATAAQANQQIESYYAELVSVKREQPGPDLPSWMMAHPAGLTDDELIQQLAQMMNGNSEATTHLISNTLLALLGDRRLGNAYARSEVQIEEAVNRVLWQDPPVPVLPARYATADTRILGTEVRAGDGVLLGLAAAHADPVLGSPEAISTSTHVNRAFLAWGAGPHRCPAERLARQIVYTAVGRLLQRLPGARLDAAVEELAWHPTPFLRGLVELPVEFPPGEPLHPPAPPRGAAPTPAQPRRSSPWLSLLTSWARGRQ
ncbi:hypothetical protein AB0J86_17635 [Micromonospora sp. NPDC049559]|uniref:hypothetical protein n=1 Tax=Micromonospora sp. NPDC049559 TaxID=3155923 RepID=UPI003435E0E1